MINFDEFMKVDLRVAKVINAKDIPEADKLIKVTVDLGNEERTIFAGIKGFYNPEELIGKNIVVVANLEPRKMRFGVSEGMLLAAGDDDEGVFLISPDEGSSAGQKVR
jgi:methionyl-tRNA synthetase